MEAFYHNIYEYQKGVRHLCLNTFNAKYRQQAEERLKKEKISYVIHNIGLEKINVYFGSRACVDIVESFNNINLSTLTPEQDYMLGIMLGYDRLMQCERYLKHLYFNRQAS